MFKSLSSGVLSVIGQTPLVRLGSVSEDYKFNLFAKMESLNPGGSIKDRTSVSILKDAFEKGLINSESTIVESSSGNMAIGLAQVCKYLGLKLIVVVDPHVNKENLHILEAFGAKTNHVTEPHPEEGFLGARLKRVNELLKLESNSFWTNQYGNRVNVETHKITMGEIVAQVKGNLDYMFVAASTCGTLMGCAEFVAENNFKTKIVAVDAVGSVLFGGEPKKRLIPGHGAGRKSQFLDVNLIYKAIQISDIESVKGCRKLLDKEIILAGGSTGAAISAIDKIKNEIPKDANVAMIVCDRGERYMQTIYNDRWVFDNLGVNLNAEKKYLRLAA